MIRRSTWAYFAALQKPYATIYPPLKVNKSVENWKSTSHCDNTTLQKSGNFALAAISIKKKNLCNEEWQAVVSFSLDECESGKFTRNAIFEAAPHFVVHRSTFSKIWSLAWDSIADGNFMVNVKSKNKGNGGRKRKDW